jgi:ABC-type branched-subunit amino acid transport system substrate-binding protein
VIAAGVIPGTAFGRAAKLLWSGRSRGGWAWLAVATAVAGCSAAPSAPTVSGKNLSIYLSAPASLSGNSQAQDVIDAEKLAFSQLSGEVHGFTLRLDVVPNRTCGGKVPQNARCAIEDSDAVAYLGEVQPGSSIDSLGITNAEDLLQVSPAQDASVPTKDFESYSTYGRTFASMAPSNNPTALLGGSAGRAFVRDFRHAFGHAPSTQATFGYAATSVVLKAIQRAGSAANNRGTVRNDFFGLKGVPLQIGPGGPVIGTYTVNKDGTLTITPGSA